MGVSSVYRALISGQKHEHPFLDRKSKSQEGDLLATATQSKPKPSQPPSAQSPRFETAGELLKSLGGIPPHRVRLSPIPGTATERDLIVENDHNDRICELIDGVLVEKATGQEESRLAALLIMFLGTFVHPRHLGTLFAPDGPSRLSPNQIRYPDVAFVARDRFQGRKNRKEPILDLAPDLAIEVLSKSNSRREMERKLCDYFNAGTRLVWYVDPKSRTVRVYTSPKNPVILGEDQTLDGGEVLQGFSLSLRDLFAELDH